MPYTQSSAAREFLPETTPEDVVKKDENKQARYRVVGQKQPELDSRGILSLRWLLLFAIIVLGICYMLYNQARLNEINGEISQVKTEIKQLESEYVRMQSGLESSLSLRSVERQAEQELGLQRLSQYQTEYVFIYEDDRVELLETSDPDGFSGKVETVVGDAVHFIKGIFGGS